MTLYIIKSYYETKISFRNHRKDNNHIDCSSNPSVTVVLLAWTRVFYPCSLKPSEVPYSLQDQAVLCLCACRVHYYSAAS